MSKKIFFGLCIVMPLMAGVGMFLLKYSVLEREKELAGIYRQMRSAEQQLHSLNAEWAYHTDPNRLRQLAKQLNVQAYRGSQIVQSKNLTDRPAPKPPVKPNLISE